MRLLSRLTSALSPRDRERREQDLKDELAFHFSTEVERRVSDGQSPSDALASAKRDFGNVPLVEEVTRDMWGWSAQDCKLGLRMLAKHPGLTLVGGLALAIAIGLSAGWYDFSRQLFHPHIPLPDGDRLVQFEAVNTLTNQRELRLLHDFVGWRRDLRSVEDLSAYRTIERTLTMADMRADRVLVAEMTASSFRVTRVAPLLGRTLIDADEQPGAPAVILISYQVWQRWFAARPDIVGQAVRLGRSTATVVGVMPEGFTFPVSHHAWMPLPLRASGYAPLEGGAITVFGRLAAGIGHREAAAELATLAAREATASPRTHAHIRLDVSPYGGEASDIPLFEYLFTHLPILLVLFVACSTVGTLVYTRTATREAEIAVRAALGAGRRRIVMQLFIEALVLATLAGAIGLVTAHFVLQWGITTMYTANIAEPPFWIHAGLTFRTVLFTAGLAVVAAAMLGVLPALKATGSQMQAELRNLGSGGSTLRFGRIWTTMMILEVALTVICLPPAFGISSEAVRDRIIRARFPTGEYVVVPVQLDRASGPADESEAAFAERMERTYGEFERRVAQEPGVVAVTFGDRLPGMSPGLRLGQVESLPGAEPARIRQLWTAAVGPGYFEAFDRPVVAGRAFHGGDRAQGARTVIVNEAFMRLITDGASPIGRRLRYENGEGSAQAEWLEIVGMVRDVGMTPTDRGEAPYVFHAVSPSTAARLVMGVRVADDATMFVPRARAIASEVDPGLRLGRVEALSDAARNQDLEAMIGAVASMGAVVLGLFLSAAAIYALMAVTVARRTREIGLRSALGGSPARVLMGVFSHAALLVGGGIVAGNLILAIVATQVTQIYPWRFVAVALLMTSLLMITVGTLACVAPARRALRINPTEALRET